jgi:DNA repair protein RadA/Sms
MSLVSSLKDVPISDDAIVFGEIGLAGEMRSVSHIDARISEASRLGFKKCILPYHSLKQTNANYGDIKLIGVKNVRDAFEAAID